MTTPSQPAITATGLRRSFGDHVVLDGIDLDVPRGTVFSLLGANGAGKTTTVKILSTLIRAGGGTATVAGHDVSTAPDAVRAAIGVTGQFSAVDNLLNGQENLFLMADLHHLGRAGRRRAADLLDQFDLAEAARKPVSTYSGGMRRRLDLAMTLVASPEVIFLDEPTTGLDPRSRRAMWQIVRDLVAGGVTVFLTTQYLDEADELADRIAVLDHGRIVAEGTPGELKRRIPGGHIELRFAGPADLEAAERAMAQTPSRGVAEPQTPSRGVAEPQATRDTDTLALRVPHDGSLGALKALIDRLDAHAVAVDSLSVHTPDLDDVFLALTGNPRPEAAGGNPRPDAETGNPRPEKVATP
ncbi:ATP-binding cassette domain-containing protein [Dactylosporangium siamense]|uniref:Daunorubicin resistance protein DrrA family ABC transporter ATP-binding protein n=1 Tax=Dactylosporangium siamense TaxID=685454 RepID=A0A919PKX1_9ACTN|nr:ATP-binding cassette domain-containing protein [Dactylosporangium siamense]GIG45111.1 daunorubicin resistance protein DrrA family ABC transporter ATP-binding protein [Dactylosporangium siamense]